jgi:dipeptidyl aminopeptidase/acylaminoacyl peptidase
VDELDKVDCIPNAQILCYPVISSDESISHSGSYKNLLGERYFEREKFSPELLVTENTPKAFIWHTANDQAVCVENSHRYAIALSRKGVPCELHVFPFGRHGLALCLDDNHVAQWKGLLVNWLKLNEWL